MALIQTTVSGGIMIILIAVLHLIFATSPQKGIRDTLGDSPCSASAADISADCGSAAD